MDPHLAAITVNLPPAFVLNFPGYTCHYSFPLSVPLCRSKEDTFNVALTSPQLDLIR